MGEVVIRRRLPAYGARLRDRRRRGELPLCVHLVYGYQWRAELKCAFGYLPPLPHPVLALKPEDYVPGEFDFTMVMGLQVCLFDQVGEAAYYDDIDRGPAQPHRSRLWWLLGELAAVAADIDLVSPVLGERWRAVELARFIQPNTLTGRRTSDAGWPFWWSQDIEEKNAKRRQNWCRIAFDAQLRCA